MLPARGLTQDLPANYQSMALYDLNDATNTAKLSPAPMDNAERKHSKTKKVDRDTERKRPAGVVREGGIAESIWKRQSPSRFAYYDFSLSRSWKSRTSGRTGYNQSFFARNKQELIAVIDRAAEEISKLEAAEGAIKPVEGIAA